MKPDALIPRTGDSTTSEAWFANASPAMDRREFLHQLGVGVFWMVTGTSVWAQARRPTAGGAGERLPLQARLHLGEDGSITVFCGKVECGQGARAEIVQAAAEELRVPAEIVHVLLADTAKVPDDGITAGSRTTPQTVPAIRRAAAAAREWLRQTAAKHWGVDLSELEVRNGAVRHPREDRRFGYSDAARLAVEDPVWQQAVPTDLPLAAPVRWQVMGQSLPRPNAREVVTGQYRYPSDLRRPGLFYGAVLRPPAFGARLVSVDLEAAARAVPGVVTVREDSFVGVAAATSAEARRALAALAATARWGESSQPSSRTIYDHLRREVEEPVPPNPFREEFTSAVREWRATYRLAYVQHVPLETRAALAEWTDQGLTVWMGTQNPFGCRAELARALGLPPEQVRVIVPDFGGGFGGKHTAEAGIEAARLARAARRPVLMHWSREEEFVWAYYRPAAVIDVEAGLDASGHIMYWHFVNMNSGRAALDTPYAVGRSHCRHVPARSPLRQGSYRALAATANHFARESAMDELAALAGLDPLDFRLRHLPTGRLRTVLEEVARRFRWRERIRSAHRGVGFGLACGTEKGSFVATCVEVAMDEATAEIRVREVVQVFECGAIVNPENLLAQVEGCILMGLGPALWEEIRFTQGRVVNGTLSRYRVPRFSDLPKLEIHLLDRPEFPSAGGGETPIVAVAPAIANAVARATGRRIRHMPIRLDAAA
ncbi:MAG: molybdopterin cofactor-binding domain-containing protein [Verrucomicrobiota bacterium]|nr:molybdopterin-dependent oxidoreductase [Limisphaera sp.]MDW8381516.1 molybdopterin cofactor-binding domain-containing protein [Verrucomicrobiota bacterium]